jgi:hypothetical protein
LTPYSNTKADSQTKPTRHVLYRSLVPAVPLHVRSTTICPTPSAQRPTTRRISQTTRRPPPLRRQLYHPFLPLPSRRLCLFPNHHSNGLGRSSPGRSGSSTRTRRNPRTEIQYPRRTRLEPERSKLEGNPANPSSLSTRLCFYLCAQPFPYRRIHVPSSVRLKLPLLVRRDHRGLYQPSWNSRVHVQTPLVVIFGRKIDGFVELQHGRDGG